MRLTNKLGLPDAFVQAVAADAYELIGDVSVTGLLDPIRKTVLTRRYWDEIEEDASNRVWSLFGTAVHQVLAQNAPRTISPLKLIQLIDGLKTLLESPGDYFQVHRETLQMLLDLLTKIPHAEHRLAIIIENGNFRSISLDEAREFARGDPGAIVISGQGDLLEDGHLKDFKCTSVWSHKFESRHDDWQKQLSIYALLYRVHGLRVQDTSIVEILRDWGKGQAARERDYPQLPVYELSFDLLDEVEVEGFVRDRARQIVSLLDAPQENLPECTQAETWYRPASFAVYSSKKNRRATRVYREEEYGFEGAEKKAGEHLSTLKGSAYVQFRPPEYPRCAGYCTASAFCHQWKRSQHEIRERSSREMVTQS